MKQFFLIFNLLAVLIFSQCQPKNTDPTIVSDKIKSNDPFAKTAVKSQFFTIETNRGNVIEGKNGTTIVAPKGCFLDTNGNVITENITIELAEALTYEEMIMTGLSTFADDEPLETDGMIYFNPTKNGEPLIINPDQPIYIEVPTKDRKGDMMAYKGEKDEFGRINWTAPKKLENYLVKIDLDLLDFLPDGFEEAVLAEMTKKGKTVDHTFIDSLYYSLSVSDGSELLRNLPPTDLNEPFYNLKKSVIDGKYQDGSFQTGYNVSPSNRNAPFRAIKTQNSIDTIATEEPRKECGIDPALIKLISSPAYQNTFIATREFEQRMQLLHSTCSQEHTELYLKNLDRDLWEIDKLIAKKKENDQYKSFRKLARQKHTNLREANIYATILKKHYEKQLKIIKKDLQKSKDQLVKELTEASKPGHQVAENYKKLLLKREFYRMPKYGFEWSDKGWVNIDKPLPPTISVGYTKPKPRVKPKNLEVNLTNGAEFEQAFVYNINRRVKSLYRFNRDSDTYFYAGNKSHKHIVQFPDENAVLIAIGYKDDQAFMTLQEYNTNDPYDFNLTLEPTTEATIRSTIASYEPKGQENSIFLDMDFVKKLQEEKKRQDKLRSESSFIQRLKELINKCCPKPDEPEVFEEEF